MLEKNAGSTAKGTAEKEKVGGILIEGKGIFNRIIIRKETR